ncbi:hypothetical protein HALDL1_08480 [Halobacterium sp. DL1]|nr:hypothetical protein HALDL1_08480 [Halobacterium sp. DL1]
MRGQAHTLEGVAAALIVVVAVAFTLQATAVTPLTASTASQHIETQHEQAAAGLLETASADGSLSATLRHWNATRAGFWNASRQGYYVGSTPNTTFGDALEATFGERSVAYNLNAYYVDGDGDRRLRRIVYNGQPSSDAVAATRLVTLYDDQPVTGTDGGPTLENASYFGPDDPGPAYGVVEVEVVVWRM